MRRPILINTSLLALVLVLAALVWFGHGQQDEVLDTPLTGLTPDQVTLIAIENHSGPAIRLERTSSGWMMQQPSAAKANDARIADLLAITEARGIRSFKAPSDLTEFGLNPPQAVLTLNRTRIEMGTLHPINQRRYMRVGDQIHLINDRFPHLLQAAPDYYLSAKTP